MTVIRPNYLNSATARRRYGEGVNLLKAEFPGPTTTSLGITGRTERVCTYDLFVVWHHLAMAMPTPPTQSSRNAAHRGPVFCPWHRFMLRQFELNLQRVLRDDRFGLPYWDWAADGQLPPSRQARSSVWADDALGGSGEPVTTGPFAFNAGSSSRFRVRIESDVNGRLVQTLRGLRRTLGLRASRLPTRADAAAALALTPYDTEPWDTTSAGFRNRVEGWSGLGAAMHNLVHMWVGGDMLPASSPNDPVFFLNHANVDRLWESWMARNGRVYLPAANAPVALRGHRLNDAMVSFISPSQTPADVLDPRADYSYEALGV